MTRLIRVGRSAPALLIAWAVTLLLPFPAWANNPNFALLRYPLFLWPVGALLSLILVALAIKAWRVRQPARRLGSALIALSTMVILGWPYLVYEKGFALDPQYRTDDLIAIVPAVGVALMALVAGLRAGRGPDAAGRSAARAESPAGPPSHSSQD